MGTLCRSQQQGWQPGYLAVFPKGLSGSAVVSPVPVRAVTNHTAWAVFGQARAFLDGGCETDTWPRGK